MFWCCWDNVIDQIIFLRFCQSRRMVDEGEYYRVVTRLFIHKPIGWDICCFQFGQFFDREIIFFTYTATPPPVGLTALLHVCIVKSSMLDNCSLFLFDQDSASIMKSHLGEICLIHCIFGHLTTSYYADRCLVMVLALEAMKLLPLEFGQNY